MVLLNYSESARVGVEDRLQSVRTLYEEGFVEILTPELAIIAGGAWMPQWNTPEYYNMGGTRILNNGEVAKTTAEEFEYVFWPLDKFANQADSDRYSDLKATIDEYVNNYTANVIIGDISLEDT